MMNRMKLSNTMLLQKRFFRCHYLLPSHDKNIIKTISKQQQRWHYNFSSSQQQKQQYWCPSCFGVNRNQFYNYYKNDRKSYVTVTQTKTTTTTEAAATTATAAENIKDSNDDEENNTNIIKEEEKQTNQQSQNEEQKEEDSLIITSKCTERITQLSQKSPNSSSFYLRIYVDAGGCSGYQYKFELSTDPPHPTDDIHFQSSKVVIDQSSMKFLKGSKIDYIDEMIKSGFAVVSNPQSESACGCGSSFAIKNFQNHPAHD